MTSKLHQAGWLALLAGLTGCHRKPVKMTVPLEGAPSPAASPAVVIASVMLVAVGARALALVASRGSSRPKSPIRSLEVGIYTVAAAGLAGLSILGLVVGWIAIGPPRDEPSLVQVTVFGGTTKPRPGVVTPINLAAYELLNILLAAGFAACAVRSRRRHVSMWRPQRSLLGLLDAVLRLFSFVVMLNIVAPFLLIVTLGPVVPIGIENPILGVGLPGGPVLAVLLTLVLVAATAALVIRLLFREGH